MRLVVQIPCYNEELLLAKTIKSIPKNITGISEIITILIDDGSNDNSVEIAKKEGVKHIFKHKKNLGLAKTFMTGINESIKLNADIIVNLDADNQYNANDINLLVKPILDNSHEIVIGTRPIEEIKNFSYVKKKLQKIGSFVVRKISGTNILDVTSGFRAISKKAALQLIVFNNFTYTLETIIQAGNIGIPTTCVDIRINSDYRKSKLVKSNFNYIKNSFFIILRIILAYQPFRFFFTLGVLLFSIGVILGVRWLLLTYVFIEVGRTHIPSLILSITLMIIGFQTCITSLLADLMNINRQHLEEMRTIIKNFESKSKNS